VAGFILKRLLRAVVVLVGVSTVVFMLLRVAGDPASLFLSQQGSPEDIEAFRRLLALDRPLHVQYFTFLSRAVTGDLGDSYSYKLPAMRLIMERMPATIELTLASMAIALVIAFPLGILAAIRRNSIYDVLCMTLAMLGQSIPVFWLGIMLILVFAVQLRLLPAAGRGGFEHLILPAIALSGFSMATLARLVRSTMLDVLGQDYMRTARAKGLRELGVIIRHGLRNAAIPIVTVIGLQFASLLGGVVVVETIFAWPGVGFLTYQAISNRDFPLVQASVLVLATIFVVINTLVDLSYLGLDPRIKYR
jgi:ABC-type dipeptide/oligopeptide/nickel transport system permease component